MASRIEIEKGVPPPLSIDIVPLAQMKKGDSILVKGYVAQHVRNLVHQFGVKSGWGFATRCDKRGNVRVWRIS